VLLLIVLASAAFAEDVGVPVTVQVVNDAGTPVSTAHVTHPIERASHAVNTDTGKWTESVLYLPNGTELIFEQGTELVLEVAAPGYLTELVTFTVKKRKNLVVVPLTHEPADAPEQNRTHRR
jgi:hypothetical protein